MRGPVYPRAGSRVRKILEALPATNAEIGDAFEMHSAEVARTMAGLRKRGFVRNLTPGKGKIAHYVAIQAERGA
jgi:CRP-like cAMP-binding protein